MMTAAEAADGGFDVAIGFVVLLVSVLLIMTCVLVCVCVCVHVSVVASYGGVRELVLLVELWPYLLH